MVRGDGQKTLPMAPLGLREPKKGLNFQTLPVDEPWPL
jgi:hypothetical protein